MIHYTGHYFAHIHRIERERGKFINSDIMYTG